MSLAGRSFAAQPQSHPAPLLHSPILPMPSAQAPPPFLRSYGPTSAPSSPTLPTPRQRPTCCPLPPVPSAAPLAACCPGPAPPPDASGARLPTRFFSWATLWTAALIRAACWSGSQTSLQPCQARRGCPAPALTSVALASALCSSSAAPPRQGGASGRSPASSPTQPEPISRRVNPTRPQELTFLAGNHDFACAAFLGLLPHQPSAAAAAARRALLRAAPFLRADPAAASAARLPPPPAGAGRLHALHVGRDPTRPTRGAATRSTCPGARSRSSGPALGRRTCIFRRADCRPTRPTCCAPRRPGGHDAAA